MNVENIAAIAHEANRVYCISINDHSQAHWEDAADWQKQSAIDGVLAIRDGRVKRAEDSHESWLQQKRADGWTFGPVKDADRKQHPCIVEFAELPIEQQRKDFVFYGVVRVLLFTQGMAQ